MSEFRLTIDTGPEGLSNDFEQNGFVLLANLERDATATWRDEDRPTPGRRYIYVTEARDPEGAVARARETVGPDVKIRVTPHGRRVQS